MAPSLERVVVLKGLFGQLPEEMQCVRASTIMISSVQFWM